MKKRMLLFTCSLALLSFFFASNNAGPALSGQGNRTGSQGQIANANCSNGTGCHSANNPATKDSVFFFLQDGITGTPSWMPGQTYKVRLLVSTLPTVTFGRFGFQISAVRDSSGVEVQAGAFSGLPGNTHIQTVGIGGMALQIVEHGPKHNMSAGTGTVQVSWTAPNTDTIDTVKFYVVANAVNNDITSAGDQPNVGMRIFPRNTTSVKDLNADIKLNIYPNPVTDKLNISMENADKGLYTIKIFDVQGKVVAKEYAVVNKNYKTSINAAAWASGMYHVQISKDGAQRTMKVLK